MLTTISTQNSAQQVFNTGNIMANAKAGIDLAAKQGVDIHMNAELNITGFSADGAFSWARSFADGWLKDIQEVAKYAKQKDPNMVVIVSCPFYHEDKTLGLDNPLYNAKQRPFNAVFVLAGGEIQAIHAKSHFPDGKTEYESRYFSEWPENAGTKFIDIKGRRVPIGKPMIQIGEGEKRINMVIEECEEGWRGITGKGKVNEEEMFKTRYLSQLVDKGHEISLALNPSASRPQVEFHKVKAREVVCKTGSELIEGGYVYTNSGPESGTAYDGGSIFAMNGKIVHRGERYSSADITHTQATLDLRVPEVSKVDVVIPHTFSEEKKKRLGKRAEWESLKDKERLYEEIVRNGCRWMGDYLLHTKQQGLVVSVSGGTDSSLGAVLATQMVDLYVKEFSKISGSKEQGVELFLQKFDHLKYADEIRDVNKAQGADAAVKLLKDKMFTFLNLPTRFNSGRTKNNAETLVNGGTRPDGTSYKGIGGQYRVISIQEVVDQYIMAEAGIKQEGLTKKQRTKLIKELQQYVDGDRKEFSKDLRPFTDGAKIPTFKDDDVTLQNIQARARLPIAMMVANRENKMACATSDRSELIMGYTTKSGDDQMGSINLTTGIKKTQVKEILDYMYSKGLHGFAPIEGLQQMMEEAADNQYSPELRKLGRDGKTAHFSERDMMPYTIIEAITDKLVDEHKSPIEVFQSFRRRAQFKGNEKYLIACIDECAQRFPEQRYKTVAGLPESNNGQNVDQDRSERVPVNTALFRDDRAQLRLMIMKDEAGGLTGFKEKFGFSYNKAKRLTRYNEAVANTIISTPIESLERLTAETFKAQARRPIISM